MKKTTKLISFFLSVFISCLVIILFSEKTYMMNTFKSETINVEDLRVGDYVENGAYLSTSNNYSFVDGGNLNDVLSLCFSKLDDDTCDEEDKIYSFSNSSPYLVDSYDKLFGTTTNYSGWKFKVLCDNSGYLLFVPANDYSDIKTIPNVENSYEVGATCTYSDKVEYTWYKKLDLDLSLTSSSGENLTYDRGNDTYSFRFKNFKDSQYTTISGVVGRTVTIEFEASKGNIFTFDYSALASSSDLTYYFLLNSNYLHTSIIYNGSYLSEYRNDMLYNTYSIEITESGKQKIEFNLYEYKNDYIESVGFYLKNPKLLSVLNEDATLNKSTLVNGQSLYYETTCEDGYVLSGTLDYVGDENLNIDTNGDGEADLNIDTDGDEKADINIDVDGDGTPDINIDTNGDGKADLNIDSDGNGIVDSEEIENPNTGAFIGFSITIITLILLTILYIKNDYKKFKKI